MRFAITSIVIGAPKLKGGWFSSVTFKTLTKLFSSSQYIPRILHGGSIFKVMIHSFSAKLELATVPILTQDSCSCSRITSIKAALGWQIDSQVHTHDMIWYDLRYMKWFHHSLWFQCSCVLMPTPWSRINPCWLVINPRWRISSWWM